MKKKLLSLALLLFFSHSLFAQLSPSKFMLSANMTHWLFTGLPELHGTFHLVKRNNFYMGIAMRGGYAYKPLQRGINVDNNVILEELHGYWGGLGFYAKHHFGKKGLPTPWVELIYVRSYAEEKGYIKPIAANKTKVLNAKPTEGC